MSRTQAQWLGDVVDAIDAIRAAEALLADDADNRIVDVVVDAMTYRVMTIGEAVKNIRAEVRAEQPSIPWQSIAGMRDVVAHQYHRRDIRILRATVDEHLEPLRVACTALLDALDADGNTLRV